MGDYTSDSRTLTTSDGFDSSDTSIYKKYSHTTSIPQYAELESASHCEMEELQDRDEAEEQEIKLSQNLPQNTPEQKYKKINGGGNKITQFTRDQLAALSKEELIELLSGSDLTLLKPIIKNNKSPSRSPTSRRRKETNNNNKRKNRMKKTTSQPEMKFVRGKKDTVTKINIQLTSDSNCEKSVSDFSIISNVLPSEQEELDTPKSSRRRNHNNDGIITFQEPIEENEIRRDEESSYNSFSFSNNNNNNEQNFKPPDNRLKIMPILSFENYETSKDDLGSSTKSPNLYNSTNPPKPVLRRKEKMRRGKKIKRHRSLTESAKIKFVHPIKTTNKLPSLLSSPINKLADPDTIVRDQNEISLAPATKIHRRNSGNTKNQQASPQVHYPSPRNDNSSSGKLVKLKTVTETPHPSPIHPESIPIKLYKESSNENKESKNEEAKIEDEDDDSYDFSNESSSGEMITGPATEKSIQSPSKNVKALLKLLPNLEDNDGSFVPRQIQEELSHLTKSDENPTILNDSDGDLFVRRVGSDPRRFVDLEKSKLTKSHSFKLRVCFVFFFTNS